MRISGPTSHMVFCSLGTTTCQIASAWQETSCRSSPDTSGSRRADRKVRQTETFWAFFERMSTGVHGSGWDPDTSYPSRTPVSGNGRDTTDILRARSRPRSSPLGPVCATKWASDPGPRPGVDGCHSKRRVYDENLFLSSAVELAFLTLTAEKLTRCMSLPCPAMTWVCSSAGRVDQGRFACNWFLDARLHSHHRSPHPGWLGLPLFRAPDRLHCLLPTARGDGPVIRVRVPHAQELRRELELLEPPVP